MKNNYAFSNVVVKFCEIPTCPTCKQHEIKIRGITYDVHWFGKGQILKHFLSLLEGLEVFIAEVQTFSHCRCDLAFLTDTDVHLNDVTSKLKGRHQNLSELHYSVLAFQKNLSLFHSDF